jgi:hypothetical protein
MPRIVREDAVARKGDRVTCRRSFQRQAILSGQHAGRAGWQWLKRVGLRRHLAFAGAEADIESEGSR